MMKTKIIIPIIFLTLTSIIVSTSLACATNPYDNTTEEYTDLIPIIESIANDTIVNTTIPNTDYNISDEYILPTPIQTNTTITPTNKTTTYPTTNIQINKSITLDNLPNPETISNQNELKNALNNGGYYTLTHDFIIGITGLAKDKECNVYIDGCGHQILGRTYFITKTDIDINAPGCTFNNTVFKYLRIDAKKDINLYNCVIYESETGWLERGAALYADSCSVIMDNCQILSCGSTCGYHGAIYLVHGWANITNTVFKNCWNNYTGSPDDEGGAIYSKYTDLYIDHCQFIDCYARDDGGAIYIHHGSTVIANSTFINCYNLKSSMWTSSNKGAAIYIRGDIRVVNCQFMNCTSDGYNDKTWKGSIDVDSHDFNIEIKNCVINYVTYNNNINYD